MNAPNYYIFVFLVFFFSVLGGTRIVKIKVDAWGFILILGFALIVAGIATNAACFLRGKNIV